MKWWTFRSLDTWFFRTGMPFNQGEASTVLPESAFPPPMQTLQGAIRTTLARGQGWVPKRRGEENPLPDGLGDGEDLGDLRLTGPFLKREDILYPVPSLLVGEIDEGTWQLTRLRPGTEVETDMGNVRLPVPADTGIKAKNIQAWLTRRGMEMVLAEGTPSAEDLIKQDDLWKSERRIGLTRDEETRTAKDQHLYFSIHTRPTHGLTVVVGVNGIPSDWHPERVTIPLGGEGRMAEVEVREEGEDKSWLPQPPQLQSRGGRLFYTATLITPGQYGRQMERVICKGPVELPGQCRSASIGKLESIGGWNLETNTPRPLEALLPAGSTWWMEADEAEWEQVLRLHGSKTGCKTEYGMGQLVIGTWNGEAVE